MWYYDISSNLQIVSLYNPTLNNFLTGNTNRVPDRTKIVCIKFFFIFSRHSVGGDIVIKPFVCVCLRSSIALFILETMQTTFFGRIIFNFHKLVVDDEGRNRMDFGYQNQLSRSIFPLWGNAYVCLPLDLYCYIVFLEFGCTVMFPNNEHLSEFSLTWFTYICINYIHFF